MNSEENTIRINKALSDRKICSRREADRLISKGKVFVNGKKAILGQRILPKDKISIKGGIKKIKSNYRYYIYNKPQGIVSHKTSDNETEAREAAGLSGDFAPVGRLDKASEGLLFLTNDGRVVDKMLNPKNKHDKEYIVKVDKDVKSQVIKKIKQGVDIEGYKTLPAIAQKINNRTLRIILQEGKKHQIRRMLANLGYTTIYLKRTRIMELKLGNLPVGDIREVRGKELNKFLSQLGLD